MILTHLIFFHFFDGGSPSDGGGGEQADRTVWRPIWRSGTRRR